MIVEDVYRETWVVSRETKKLKKLLIFNYFHNNHLLIIKIITMPWIEYVGLFGAFLSSITFIPQVWQAWKTKSVGDLSLGMLLIVFTSVIVWLVYGFYLNLLPVIIANAIIFLLSILLLYFKFTFPKKEN